MAKTYAIVNNKSGCSKTTTCGALASASKRIGLRTLVVDADPQGSVTQWCGIDSDNLNTAYEVLMRKCPANDAIIDVKRYDLVPANPTLSRVEPELANRIGGEFRLREALDEVEGAYDIILIDTPPALGLLTVSAITAADDGVIVPSDTSPFAAKGMADLAEALEAAAKYGNANARVTGILLTRFNPRYGAMKAMREATTRFGEYFDAPVYDTFIRQTTGMLEAQLESRDLFEMPRLNAAIQDYAEFSKEFLLKEGLAEPVDPDETRVSPARLDTIFETMRKLA